MCTTATPTAIALKNILVATDLTPASLWSVPFVTAMAQQYRSTVFLAHVIPLGTFKVARPESFDAIEVECRDYAQDKLDRLSARIRAQEVTVQSLIGEGDVAVVICDWVDRQKIDLLAVGTSGRTGLRKLALGSIAEELIRRVRCPILTFGPCLSTEAPPPLRSILYATDLSASSLRAGIYAYSLAHRYDARLVILHVAQEHTAQASRRILVRQLRDLVPKDSGLATQLEELVAYGRPAAKILEIANEHAVDLIAMGVRGSGGPARASSHFGSTAHDVAVGATCPVLVVGAPQHQSAEGQQPER